MEKDEILIEPAVMKKTGIGGVEINSIAMPAEIETSPSECLKWESPEWAQMVKITEMLFSDI